MIKRNRSSRLSTNVTSRFLINYLLAFFTIFSLTTYILISDKSGIKYDLKSFNIEVQDTIKNTFNDIEDKIKTYSMIISKTNDSIHEIISSDKDFDKYFKAVYVLDQNLTPIYSKKTLESTNLSLDLPWLSKLKDKGVVWSKFLFVNKRLKTFFIAYGINENMSIVAEVNLKYLNFNIARILNESNLDVYVVDHNGNFITGVYGSSGYNENYYREISNVDDLFIKDNEVTFSAFDMMADFTLYMPDYKFFVVTYISKKPIILIGYIVLFLSFILFLFYSITTFLNVQFAKKHLFIPLRLIMNFLKNKKRKPKGKYLFLEFNTIIDFADGLYKDIENVNNTLVEYRSRFGHIFEKGPLIILVYDAYNGEIINASSQALDFYGYTKEEMLGLNISDISELNFSEVVFKIRDRFDKKIKLGSKHKVKGGQLKDVMTYASIIDLADNEKCVFVVVTDISDELKYQANNEIISKHFVKFQSVVLVSTHENPFAITNATKNIYDVFGIDQNYIFSEKFDLRDIIYEQDRVAFVNEIELNKRLFLNVPAYENNMNSVIRIHAYEDKVIPFNVNVKFGLRPDNTISVAYYFVDYSKQQILDEKYISEVGYYKTLFRSTKAISFEYNSKSEVIKVGAGLADMLDFENINDIVFNETHMKNILVDGFEDFKSFFRCLKVDDKLYSGDIRLYDKAKNIVWFHVNAKSIKDDEQGNPLTIYGTISNVTDKRISLVYQNLASNLFSFAKDGVALIDLGWNFIDANDAFCDISGYSRDELMGSNISLTRSKLSSDEFYEKTLSDVERFGRWNGKFWSKRKNGEDHLETVNIFTINDSEQRTVCYAVMVRDIADISSTQHYLEHIAYHDPLTKLPNRFLFSQKLEEAMRLLKPEKNIAIAYLDMDGFKNINDVYGHKAGDFFLYNISSKIDSLFEDRDMFARIGGDEFVAIIVHEHLGEVYEMIDNMLKLASENITYEDFGLKISASIGVAIHDKSTEAGVENLLEQADWAMYQAKMSGKNRYYVFDSSKDRHFKNQYEDNNKIAKALENNEFYMVYQPEINIKTNTIVSFEALLRWTNNDKIICPNEIFGLVKKQGLLEDISLFTIKSVLEVQKKWQENGFKAIVCVNVGMNQLCNDLFYEKVKQMIEENSFNVLSTQIEIIDANLNPDLESANKMLKKYKRLGFKFVLDDFTSKKSSFEALELLCVDRIKVDKNLCKYIFFNQKAFMTVSMIKKLSDIFEKPITIKNLKDLSTFNVMIGLGFENFQGDFFQKPVLEEDVPKLNFNGIDGANLEYIIGENDFDVLKDCIILKEYAQSIITYFTDQQGKLDKDDFELLKDDILDKLDSKNGAHTQIVQDIKNSLNAKSKDDSLVFARKANIQCLKVLNIDNNTLNNQ